MRLLLDTHVAVWAASDIAKIPLKVRKLVGDPRNDVFVSVASIWEIAIKTSRGPAKGMPFSGATAGLAFERLGFVLLGVLPRHAAAVGDCAVAHADPFDRMILAQALSESMRLVTADAMLSRYSDTIITW